MAPILPMQTSPRLLKIILVIVGAALGLYGVALFTIFVLLHLCSLRSFGVPYLAPLAPFVANDQKDSLVRLSLEQITNDESTFTK